MKTSRLVALSLLACGLLACEGTRRVDTPAEARTWTTSFPHEKHQAVDCTDCHTAIPRATRLGRAEPPDVAKCKECHDLASMSAPDRAAHTPRPREAAEHSITFDHAAHLRVIKAKDASEACKTCHKEDRLPEPGPARSVTPDMKTCTACHHHEQEVAETRCTPCHVSLRRFPLKPIEALAGFSHRGDFVHAHGKLVKNTAETCAQCHDQTFCARCHATATVPFRTEIQFPEKVESNFIHRGDYVSRHQIEAAATPDSCRKCHGSYFCDSCHAQQNISPRVSLGGGTPRNPHPAGWANPGSGQFHGTAARQNIVSCAACHDQGPASICVTCHRSLGPGQAGIGGSPHGPGFNKSRADIRRNSMCLACHTNG